MTQSRGADATLTGVDVSSEYSEISISLPSSTFEALTLDREWGAVRIIETPG
jgi:hypothetical protein